MSEFEIDGGMGEAGGQILRTALTLSMCLGSAIRVKNIRAGRNKPGLLRQHLACVKAAAQICSAEVENDELGATEIRFVPGKVKAGTYEFRIGSAGSTTLLMQTILPALALADESSSVLVHGGTHNGMAPSVDFIELAYFPILNRLGLTVESELQTHGFYPNGGGCWQVEVQPWRDAQALQLTERGTLKSKQAVATLSNLQRHIAERELERISKKMRWPEEDLVVKQVSTPGPGNIVSLRCEYEEVTEVFEAVGALGVSAERVAGRAIGDAKRFMQSGYAVSHFLADQLLLPMVLTNGGEFSTGTLSDHCLTNMALINQLLGEAFCELDFIDEEDGTHSIVRIPRGLALTR